MGEVASSCFKNVRDVNDELDTDDAKQTTQLLQKQYTLKEISSHYQIENGVWLLINNKVYDVTKFVEQNMHPGGNQFLYRWAGKNGTEAFENAQHSQFALTLLKKYYIGNLKQSYSSNLNTTNTNDNSRNPRSISRAISKVDISSVRNREILAKKQNKQIRITKIFIFPLKSCKGVSLKQCRITSSGMENDRIYAFYEDNTMTVVNQLTYPLLCKIQPSKMVSNVNKNTDMHNTNASDFSFGMHLEIVDNDSDFDGIDVPVINNEKALISVKWRASSKPLTGYDQGQGIADWITKYMTTKGGAEESSKFRLVRIDSEKTKRTAEKYFQLPFLKQSQQQISATQNYAAVNLASEESLKELNDRYLRKLADGDGIDDDDGFDDHDDDGNEVVKYDWERLRVNIVISGVSSPHFEDYMKNITFSDSDAELLWTRRRYFCSVPNIDQNNGALDLGMHDILSRYRNAITLNDRTSKPRDDAIFFGSFFIVKHSGEINIESTTVNTKHSEINLKTDSKAVRERKTFHGLKHFMEDADAKEESMIDESIDYLTGYHLYKLISKIQVNSDCFLFRFTFSDDLSEQIKRNTSLHLESGDHWFLRVENDDNDQVIRAYTPLLYGHNYHKNGINTDELEDMKTNDDDNGNNGVEIEGNYGCSAMGILENDDDEQVSDEYFDLLIKIYNDSYAKLTPYLYKLKVGEHVQCKRNRGQIKYIESGKFQIGDPQFRMFDNCEMSVKCLNLIAGGTGITPIYQILCSIHLNSSDFTNVQCIIANRTPNDILLRDELENIDKMNEYICVHFIVGNNDNKCKYNGDIGRIDSEIIEKYLYPQTKNEDCATIMCGPPLMMREMSKLMQQYGFRQKHIQEF